MKGFLCWREILKERAQTQHKGYNSHISDLSPPPLASLQAYSAQSTPQARQVVDRPQSFFVTFNDTGRGMSLQEAVPRQYL